jgi:hypothetical protein
MNFNVSGWLLHMLHAVAIANCHTIAILLLRLQLACLVSLAVMCRLLSCKVLT